METYYFLIETLPNSYRTAWTLKRAKKLETVKKYLEEIKKMWKGPRSFYIIQSRNANSAKLAIRSYNFLKRNNQKNVRLGNAHGKIIKKEAY